MTAPPPPPAPPGIDFWWQFARLRLGAINTFIATLLVVLAIDVIPGSPQALRLTLQRVLVPLGIAQGPWDLFAPKVDQNNMKVRAEITYRDGVRRDWAAPEWRKQSPAAMWTGHRRHEWIDHVVSQEAAPVWENWCKALAREQRPDFPEAERGATVRLIYRLGPIRSADLRPWHSFREPSYYEDFEGLLITERFPE